MKHVVLSTGSSGQPQIDDAASLDEALQLVERLRNDDAVEDVRVLREVPIEVKTYYKVVAVEGADEASTATAPAPAVEAAPSDDLSAEVAAATDPVADGGDLAEPEVAEMPPPAPEPAGDDGFFTPPPVRSHPIEEEEPLADNASERRTSLFGRG